MASHIDLTRHPITEPTYIDACKRHLAAEGALALNGFFRPESIQTVVDDSLARSNDVFYADSTHNVYLSPSDPALETSHPFNRQVASSKGLIAQDQIPTESPLREVYESSDFMAFISGVLGITAVYPYDDSLSSINVHFADAGRELGWHFDNSSFAVTMLLQAPKEGGRFEYVPDVRNADLDEMGFDTVTRILDGTIRPSVLEFDPGALVLFRGRNSMHRVTPSKGPATRLLAVFAYNSEPGVRLSDSALTTFFGRTS